MSQALSLNEPQAAPLFNGRNSIKGKQWVIKPTDPVLTRQMMQMHNLPEIAASILSTRSIAPDALEAFLAPRLSTHFPDPFSLKGMTQAVEHVADAIMEGQTIGILADFDVDGATSCAVMTRFLRSVTGHDTIPFFIPDRLNDGYGPSEKGFDRLYKAGSKIVVTLDSGITSHDPIAHAKSLGLGTIIIDHHEADPEKGLPNATHIINPKQPGDNSGLSMLAAVGVTFLFCVAVNSVLRARGFYEDRQEPDIKALLDLVALGTVCDMVPLTGPNRLFVKYGFAEMEKRNNPGLCALMEVSKITGIPDPYDAGFMLGPRINAGSRVHQSDLGARLLSATDREDALNIAWLLDDCNRKRQEIQKEMTKEATSMVTALGRDNDPVILVGDKDWHTGLTGLVAGTLKERYGRPACAFGHVSVDEGVELRGSGRSVPGIHIASAFMDAQSEGHLVKGGGHAMAGGFTLTPDMNEGFHQFLVRHIAAQGQNLDPTPKKEADCVIGAGAISVSLAELLSRHLSPFGMGNEEPQLIVRDVHILKPDVVGQTHLRCLIRDANGGTSTKAIAFRSADAPLGQTLKQAASNGAPVHLMGCVKLNEWQGRVSAEFHIDDVMPCW